MPPHSFFDETNLVRPERTARPARWWAIFVVAFAILLSLYVLSFDSWRSVRKPATSPGDLQHQKVQRFLSRDHVDVVIVGSSLSNKMRDELFRWSEVSNLALPGGSFLTGLEIVAQSNRRPRLVLAEINLLERELNTELVRAYGELPPTFDRLRMVLRDLKPIRTVFASSFGVHPDAQFMLKRAQRVAGERQEADDLPATAERNGTLKLKTQALFDKLAADESVLVRAEDNFSRALSLASKLEERGTKVRFVFLPVAPDLAGHPYVQAILRIVRQRLPSAAFAALQVPVDQESLTWTDGMHMDSRSSAIYLNSLEKAVPELRGEGTMAAGSATKDTKP
jgi:hypothetical protein